MELRQRQPNILAVILECAYGCEAGILIIFSLLMFPLCMLCVFFILAMGWRGGGVRCFLKRNDVCSNQCIESVFFWGRHNEIQSWYSSVSRPAKIRNVSAFSGRHFLSGRLSRHRQMIALVAELIIDFFFNSRRLPLTPSIMSRLPVM